jgi:hypothetical protein
MEMEGQGQPHKEEREIRELLEKLGSLRNEGRVLILNVGEPKGRR